MGLETIAAALGEDSKTIEDVYEPYLLQEGIIQRTPRGRKISPEGYRLMGYKVPSLRQQLFRINSFSIVCVQNLTHLMCYQRIGKILSSLRSSG